MIRATALETHNTALAVSTVVGLRVNRRDGSASEDFSGQVDTGCLLSPAASHLQVILRGNLVVPTMRVTQYVRGRDQQALVGRYHLLRLRDEFVFLAVILNTYSRRVIGWRADKPY